MRPRIIHGLSTVILRCFTCTRTHTQTQTFVGACRIALYMTNNRSAAWCTRPHVQKQNEILHGISFLALRRSAITYVVWCLTVVIDHYLYTIFKPTVVKLDTMYIYISWKSRHTSKSHYPKNVATCFCQLTPINAAPKISPHGKGSTAIYVCAHA